MKTTQVINRKHKNADNVRADLTMLLTHVTGADVEGGYIRIYFPLSLKRGNDIDSFWPNDNLTHETHTKVKLLTSKMLISKYCHPCVFICVDTRRAWLARRPVHWCRAPISSTDVHHTCTIPASTSPPPQCRAVSVLRHWPAVHHGSCAHDRRAVRV